MEETSTAHHMVRSGPEDGAAKKTPLTGTPWVYHGVMFSNISGQSMYAPALAVHNGRLWGVWAQPGALLSYSNGTNAVSSWAAPKQIYLAGNTPADEAARAPALTDLNGTLHTVYVSRSAENNQLVHLQYDDQADRWGKRVGLAVQSENAPALAAFDGQLFCAFTKPSTNELLYCIWTEKGGWTGRRAANQKSYGTPGMYVVNGSLHMLFSANDTRQIRELVYTSAGDWQYVTGLPESTAFGVSAASELSVAYAGFQENANSGSLYVSVFDQKWNNHESTNQFSRDTPALAVLNGVPNCVFNARNPNGDLLLCQRTSASLDSWMSKIPDNRDLSQLSLPGTHNSCASGDLRPFVNCQTMSVTDQLDTGIRYFDLRCGLSDGTLYMYHNGWLIRYPSGVMLESVLQSVYAWLDRHPSEGLMIQVKQEGPTADPGFGNAVVALLQKNVKYWSMGKTTPTLGNLRGKIQLMRRFSGQGIDLGIDVDHWPDNNPDFTFTTSSGVVISGQDQYASGQYDSLDAIVAAKRKVIESFLVKAAKGPMGQWYLNFTSAVASGPNYWAEPKPIAVGSRDLWIYTPGVNARLRDYLRGNPKGRYGALLMDYPEAPADDLTAAIVASNI